MIIYYAEDCISKVKLFKNMSEAKFWVAEFYLKHLVENDLEDNWIFMIVKGDIDFIGPEINIETGE